MLGGQRFWEHLAALGVALTGLLSSPGPAKPSLDRLPLAGKVVVIDPGHDGGNASAPSAINSLVPAGGFRKSCDTAGTATDAGYPEHAFTFDVALRTAAILRREGATVVLTRTDDRGVGPCVDERAAIGNAAHADAAISIHADGGPASGYGFQVIEPGPIRFTGGSTARIVAPSARLALSVRAAFRRQTGEHYSTYAGTAGITRRTDLGGLNLSTVPKVFIECANMRNAVDARHVSAGPWRQEAANGIAAGLAAFLLG